MTQLDAFLNIARRGQTFTSLGGRAFITVGAQSLGDQTLAVRSRAFRQWFYDQAYSELDTIPSAYAFSAILHHLEAQAVRDPNRCQIRVPFRVDSRGHSPIQKILLDLANPDGQFVEITPAGWQVASGQGVPFETSRSTWSLPVPIQAATPNNDPHPLDTLRTTLNLGPPDSPDWLRCLAWLFAALRPNGP